MKRLSLFTTLFLIICLSSFSQVYFDGTGNTGSSFSQTYLTAQNFSLINQESMYFNSRLSKKMLNVKDFLPINSPQWVLDNKLSEIKLSLHKYSKNVISPKSLEEDSYKFNQNGQLSEIVLNTNSFQYTYNEKNELAKYSLINLKKKDTILTIKYKYQYNDLKKLVHLEKDIFVFKALLAIFGDGIFSYDLAYNDKGTLTYLYVVKDSKTEYFRSLKKYSDTLLVEEDICSRAYKNVWHSEDTFDSVMCNPKNEYFYNEKGLLTKMVMYLPIMPSQYVGYVARKKPVASAEIIYKENIIEITAVDEMQMGVIIKTQFRFDKDGNLLEKFEWDARDKSIKNKLTQSFDNQNRLISKYQFLSDNFLSYGYLYMYDEMGKISKILSINPETKIPDMIYIFDYVSK